MQGLAVCIAVAAVSALAIPAAADAPVHFTLGRVVHTTPDSHDRIGIRSACDEAGGCKVKYAILQGTRSLGAIDALLLADTVQTDYVRLTKSMARTLRKRRIQVTITAEVSSAAGARATQTKTVVLGPKKKRRR